MLRVMIEQLVDIFNDEEDADPDVTGNYGAYTSCQACAGNGCDRCMPDIYQPCLTLDEENEILKSSKIGPR